MSRRRTRNTDSHRDAYLTEHEIQLRGLYTMAPVQLSPALTICPMEFDLFLPPLLPALQMHGMSGLTHFIRFLLHTLPNAT